MQAGTQDGQDDTGGEMSRKRYMDMLKALRLERGEFCEACSEPARHAHHIIPCSEVGIDSELVYEPANLMMLCDECHALMHPLIRNISQWQRARQGRGQAILQC